MNKFQKIIDRNWEMYYSANEKDVFTRSEKNLKNFVRKYYLSF